MKIYEDISKKKGDFIKQIEEVVGMQDYYVAHEYCEDLNNPLYLNEFVDLIKKENLFLALFILFLQKIMYFCLLFMK